MGQEWRTRRNSGCGFEFLACCGRLAGGEQRQAEPGPCADPVRCEGEGVLEMRNGVRGTVECPGGFGQGDGEVRIVVELGLQRQQ